MLSSRDNMLPYAPRPVMLDRRWKPSVELAPNCPRCDSSNTKFCYYNNYSRSQPRYFCKGCRRYWTKGGSLRNVPVGGGCRKNRRGKPVRLQPSEPGSTGRDLISHGRRPTGPLRPDLALDGIMVGDYLCQLDGNGPAQSATDGGASGATAGGSTIDLAALYAKFLNQCPDLEPSFVPAPELHREIDEPFDPIGGPSQSYPNSQMPTQLPARLGLAECQRPSEPPGETLLCNANRPPSLDGEFRFSDMDPIGFEPSALPFNGFFSANYPTAQNLSWEAAAKHQGFFESSVPEDSLSLQQNLIIPDWSTLEYSTLEAFYRS